MLWAGNFADVYKVHCPATGNTWALKCFTREVRGLQERYRAIAAHLAKARLPFTVDFQFLERGIRLGGRTFPILKMRWVEGQTLTQFVAEHLDRPQNLKMLLDLWVKLAVRLRQAQIAHADLQHGNVLLVPASGGSLALRLIDYDGMHIPALAGAQSGEVGHPAYQHPQRLRESTYSMEVDRFSHLAIYTSVYCLSIGQRALWERYNNGDNLLFRETDFREPKESELFRHLWALGDSDTRSLVGRLILACRRPLSESPLLDQIVTDGHARPLSGDKLSAVESFLYGKRTPSIPAPSRPEIPLPKAPASGSGSDSVAALSTEQWEAGPLAPVKSLLRPATRPFAALIRRVDRVLAAAAGEGNTILHNFFRTIAVAALAAILLGGATLLHRALPSISGNESGTLQASKREAAPIKAGAEREAGRIKAKPEKEANRIREEPEKEAGQIKAKAERDAKRIKEEAEKEAKRSRTRLRAKSLRHETRRSELGCNRHPATRSSSQTPSA